MLEMPVVEPTFNIGPPPVNIINLHSSVWTMLHILSDDDGLKPEHRLILTKARDALDEFVTPEILYDIMRDEGDRYVADPYNMLVYADLILTINEEKRELRYAQ